MSRGRWAKPSRITPAVSATGINFGGTENTSATLQEPQDAWLQGAHSLVARIRGANRQKQVYFLLNSANKLSGRGRGPFTHTAFPRYALTDPRKRLTEISEKHPSHLRVQWLPLKSQHLPHCAI